MGFRINKVMGYGLNDLHTKVIDIDSVDNETRQADDARVDLECLYGKREFSDASYLSHLDDLINSTNDEREKGDLMSSRLMLKGSMLASQRTRPNISLENSYEIINGISYDSELGKPDTIILTPPEMVTTWMRRDDAIDYAETQKDDEMVASVDILEKPLFPYDGWIHAITGNRVSYEEIRYIQTINRVNQGDDPGKDEIINNLLGEVGFISLEDIKVNCVPIVPASIKALMSWTGILTSNDVIRQLRPMIYTYWS